jgi:hypothetical protein
VMDEKISNHLSSYLTFYFILNYISSVSNRCVTVCQTEPERSNEYRIGDPFVKAVSTNLQVSSLKLLIGFWSNLVLEVVIARVYIFVQNQLGVAKVRVRYERIISLSLLGRCPLKIQKENLTISTATLPLIHSHTA